MTELLQVLQLWRKKKGNRNMENKIKPYLKSKLPEVSPYFYGRKEELEEIDRIFQSGEHVLFLQGIGGIGKSELAKQYAVSHKEQYETVIFAQCISDLRKLMINDEEIPIALVTRGEKELEGDEEEEAYLERKLKVLKELENENVLIIIDDLNQKSDVNLSALLRMKYKLLITSRADWSTSGYPYMPIQPLHNIEDIKKIFYAYYGKQKTEQEDKLVTKLIGKVKGHTLTVEWLAKQMADGSVTLEEMDKKLEEGNLSDAGDTLEGFYAKLKDVFSVGDLSDSEKDVLRVMALLPYTGISREDLITRSKRGCHAGVLKLMRNSWIEFGGEMEYIYLHPVIAEVVLQELKPTWKNCSYFIQNVEKDLIDTKLENRAVEKLFPIAMNIIEILGTKEEESISFMLDLAYALQFRKGEYHMAEHYANWALRAQALLKETIDQELEKMQRDVLDIHYNELTTAQYNAEKCMCLAINRLGCICYEQKKYEEALEEFKRLLNYLPMAEPFCNIASCYQNMGNLEEALHYTKLGLAYKQKRFGQDNPHNFSYFKQFGVIYTQMKEEDEAIYYFEEARKIIEKEVKEQDLYKAQFYGQYAAALKQMKHFQEALEMEVNALQMKRALLGENHVEVAKSCASMAYCCYYLGQYENTLMATLQEIRIRKNIGQIKLNLYLSVKKLLPMLEDRLEKNEKLRIMVDEAMAEWNDLLQKYPDKTEEIMSQ